MRGGLGEKERGVCIRLGSERVCERLGGGGGGGGMRDLWWGENVGD